MGSYKPGFQPGFRASKKFALDNELFGNQLLLCTDLIFFDGLVPPGIGGGGASLVNRTSTFGSNLVKFWIMFLALKMEQYIWFMFQTGSSATMGQGARFPGVNSSAALLNSLGANPSLTIQVIRSNVWRWWELNNVTLSASKFQVLFNNYLKKGKFKTSKMLSSFINVNLSYFWFLICHLWCKSEKVTYAHVSITNLLKYQLQFLEVVQHHLV